MGEEQADRGERTPHDDRSKEQAEGRVLGGLVEERSDGVRPQMNRDSEKNDGRDEEVADQVPSAHGSLLVEDIYKINH